MKIGIIIGSIRDGRKGGSVADWVLAGAQARGDADYELIDLRAFDVPPLTAATVPMAAKRQYDSAAVRAWGAAIDACDGFVFVTPEYNHGVPGAFKNAVDSLGPEWVGKTVAFVGYGADGGVRAIENWRIIVVNFQMVDVRGAVALSTFTEFGESGFAPLERRTGELTSLLDQLITMTGKLRG